MDREGEYISASLTARSPETPPCKCTPGNAPAGPCGGLRASSQAQPNHLLPGPQPRGPSPTSALPNLCSQVPRCRGAAERRPSLPSPPPTNPHSGQSIRFCGFYSCLPSAPQPYAFTCLKDAASHTGLCPGASACPALRFQFCPQLSHSGQPGRPALAGARTVREETLSPPCRPHRL